MDIGRDKTVSKIVSRLTEPETRVVKVEGTWGSFAPLLAAHINRKTGRPILYIAPHIDDADRAADDLRTFGSENVETLNAWEGEEEIADATDQVRIERLRLVSQFAGSSESQRNTVVTASVQALCQPVAKPAMLLEHQLRLCVEEETSPDKVVQWLVDNGFERVDRIDLPGQFAQRGGIVDIYAPLTTPVAGAKASHAAEAIRIEFFGDIIESIREIDLDTHRSSGQIQDINILSVISGAVSEQQEMFVNVLPDDCILLLEEPATVEETAGTYLSRVDDPTRLYDWGAMHKGMSRLTQLHLCRFATEATSEFLKVGVQSIQQYQHKATSVWAGHKAALQELIQEARRGKTVLLYCESSAELKRVGEIIEQINKKIPPRFELLLGFISQGFAVDSLNTIVVSHHELFGQYTIRRRRTPARAASPVDSLADLQEGDYVVHASYGIGKFIGTRTIQEKGGSGEYLTIEYADSVTMQVSVHNIALVQKYIGTSPKRPRLSKVGSKKWQKQKDKVAASVADLAAELLNVQAERQAVGGIAYPLDSNWQLEFEESFPYTETPDQTTANEQIKGDMRQPVAMDRLLCGDVGYGKTELAMRAAFKAVENSKQVAVLVPTTVLCVQHSRTFGERFADFPVTIETLNRFKTAKQAKDIIARAKKGRVDILIGTHRLLSSDVGFKDLGLLIIDEEQRFGVAHKERLKKLRVNVDVLTMTATPIPRTLHMSLLGLRDISSLTTAPLDRRSIVTKVTRYSHDTIRRAIHHELNRQGQVFFLHNRVRSIDRKAFEIQKLVPEARVAIAHGQMTKRELEDAMIRFVVGDIDVLVCTTIIESGLDIPNANTIFIDDADRFGLAELHQLRGRVGRYKHRAYAYMLMPQSRSITPIAAKRLKAIEDYSHLGAGFRIALRDLEIRGAGNILGAEQSGHIQMVGYQMYCEMLAEAVRRHRNEPVLRRPSVTVDLGFPVYVPRNYIPISKHRMEVYRKIALAKTPGDIEQIETELADVYGPPPEQVDTLLDVARIRIKAARAAIRSIVTSGDNLVFSFTEDPAPQVESLFGGVAGKVWLGESQTVYMRLSAGYFEPGTLLSLLRKVFAGQKNE